MAVIKVDGSEVKAELGLTEQSPGCGTRQQIGFAIGQRGKTNSTSNGLEFDFLGIAKDGCSNAAADTDVAAGPHAIGRQLIEAG